MGRGYLGNFSLGAGQRGWFLWLGCGLGMDHIHVGERGDKIVFPLLSQSVLAEACRPVRSLTCACNSSPGLLICDTFLQISSTQLHCRLQDRWDPLFPRPSYAADVVRGGGPQRVVDEAHLPERVFWRGARDPSEEQELLLLEFR